MSEHQQLEYKQVWHDECLAAGLKDPIFKYEETGLMVELGGEIPADMSGKMSGKISGKTSGKISGKMSGKILDLLKANPTLTVSEISSEISRTERSVSYYIQELQESGCLVRVGSRKEGHWKVLS